VVGDSFQPAGLIEFGNGYYHTPSGAVVNCHTVYYVAASGAEVFYAGTEGWGFLIATPAVGQMTWNVIDRFAARAQTRF
jgi:hypothetical protein